MTALVSPEVVAFGVVGGAAAVAASVAAVAWQYRDRPGGAALAATMALVAWWMVTYLGELGATALGTKLLFAHLQWFASTTVPVAWLLFALEYTGRGEWVRPSVVGALTVLPAVTVFLVWTNPSHGLVRVGATVVRRGDLLVFDQSWGPFFWVAVAYAYALAAVGGGLFVELVVRETHLFRGQAVAVLAAALSPLAANLVYVLGLSPVAGLDLTPVGFAASGLAGLFAVARFRFLRLGVAPGRLGRQFVLDSLSDGVVVLDVDDSVVAVNASGQDFLAVDDPVGRPAAAVVPGFGRESPEEQVVELDGGRYVELRRSEVRDHHDHRVGEVVLLRDVTERQRTRQRLDVLDRVLRHNLRNEMNVLDGYAELCESGAVSPEEFTSLVRRKSAALVELGDNAQTIERILAGDEEPVDALATLQQAVGRARAAYPDVEVTLDAPADCAARCQWAFAPVVANLVENAAEHNTDPDPRVAVEFSATPSEVTVVVSDNGPGLPEVERRVVEERRETPTSHGLGLGLWVVNWGVSQLGGEVRFDDRDPKGTAATLRVPRAEADAATGE
ncbi:MAG: histidine kinase N-terminal 7TM domain-containing protein [Halobacteriaceae archaeon]